MICFEVIAVCALSYFTFFSFFILFVYITHIWGLHLGLPLEYSRATMRGSFLLGLLVLCHILLHFWLSIFPKLS